MSKSTPADLAVAFRSLERRRREAVEASGGAAVAGSLGQLDQHIAAAATLVGAAASAGAIADALAAKPADEWDEATLDAVREHATGAGTAIRQIADAGGTGDDDEAP